MKKTIKSLFALCAVLLAASCSDDVNVVESVVTEIGETQAPVFTASITSAGTRNQLGEKSGTEYPVLWETGDEVALVSRVSGTLYKVVYQVEEGGSTNATLKIKAGETYNIPAEGDVVAVFPADAVDLTASEGKAYIAVNAKSAQTYVAGNIDHKAFQMFAQISHEDISSDNLNLSFVNPYTILQFNVTSTVAGAKLNSVKIAATSAQIQGYCKDRIAAYYKSTDSSPQMDWVYRPEISGLNPYYVTVPDIALDNSTPLVVNMVCNAFADMTPNITLITDQGSQVLVAKSAMTCHESKIYPINLCFDGASTTAAIKVRGSNMFEGLTKTEIEHVVFNMNSGSTEGTELTPYDEISTKVYRYYDTETKTVYFSTRANKIYNYSADGTSAFQYLFDGMSNLVDITGLENYSGYLAPTLNVWNMFNGCSSLESVDLSCLSGATVKEFERMFAGCKKLKTITGLNNIVASVVTSCASMFDNCQELETIDLSNFAIATTSVNRTSMFWHCYKLSSLTLSNNFKMGSGTIIDYMFKDTGRDATSSTIHGVTDETIRTALQRALTSAENTKVTIE